MARKKKQSDIPGILIVVGIVAYVVVKVAPILLAVGVIIMVVYLLVKVATYFADSSDHQGFRNRSQSHYTGTTQPRQSGGTQLSSVQTRQLQAPPQAPRTDRNTQKFNELMRKYTVTTVPSLSLPTDPLQVEMDEWKCVEVLQAVNRIINQRLETTTQMNSIKREMDSILKCQGCVNVKEKVEYLEKNESLLSSKLSEYNKGRETLKACKVTLLDKHPGFFPSFRSGMAQIVNSRKAININGTSIHSVIKLESTLPDGLFASTTTPIEINSGEYRYYLLPEVILAFNMQYQFITAIEPRALSVRCNEREKGVNMVRGARYGDWTHYDTLIASDSIKVSEGIIRSSWLHTRKDGGPDQRYRNNPITQTRTDTYRHGEVVIILGRYKTAFSISAGDVSAKIRAAVYNYTRLKHELNATPSLLRLLMSTSKKTENALALSERYESINNNTFCKIG